MSQLQNFFNRVGKEQLKKPGAIICTGQEYPVLFFSHLLSNLRFEMPVQIVDVSAVDESLLLASLQTSFLSGTQLYFLKNLSDLPASDKKRWLSYCNSYNGPHTILCFFNQEDLEGDQAGIAQVPFEIENAEYHELVKRFFPQVAEKNTFTKALFENRKTVSLDTACLLVFYHMTVGRSTHEFFARWGEVFLAQQASLFNLSQLLFEKNSEKFLELWAQCGQEYPAEFWISFWSEQFWQAFVFLSYAHKNKAIEGRRLVTRLPFTFLQRDWRKYKLGEISLAHSFLYDMDYQLKNGISESYLEIFYYKFLEGFFCLN